MKTKTETRTKISERITRQPEADEQLLYFTSTSLTADDRRLVFISDRTGHPNLFDRDLDTGEERQLTRNAEGHLKSYVYFHGEPYRGLGKASVSLHAPSGTVYYLNGREIRKVGLEGKERTLAEYPFGQMTAFTHVSSDGKRLCVPTTDSRADRHIDKIFRSFPFPKNPLAHRCRIGIIRKKNGPLKFLFQNFFQRIILPTAQVG